MDVTLPNHLVSRASSLWLLKSTTDIKAPKVRSDTLILAFNSHLISAYFIIYALLGCGHILKLLLNTNYVPRL